jgi:hypothetical protein
MASHARRLNATMLRQVKLYFGTAYTMSNW